MILFKPEHVQPILSGLKTETRRPWKKPRAKRGSIHKAKTHMLSKNHFAQLLIIGTRRQRLLLITESEAKKEGGYTRKEYLDLWDTINPKAPAWTNPFVWVVEFKLYKRNATLVKYNDIIVEFNPI